MPSASTDSVSQSNPFIRQLASSERETRERALSALRTYIHRSAAFTPLEFLKLWKGLHYCMFMTDKPRNQQQLARDLADLVDNLTTRENILGFLEGFWKTIGREWASIDSLRMDKYMYLVRCYTNKGFEVCSRKSWADEALLDKYLEMLRAEGGPLSPRDAKVPNGLRLHLLDIWFDELDKVDHDRTAPLSKLELPIRKLGQKTLVKSVRESVNEALADERLQNWAGERKTSAEVGSDEEDMEEDFAGFQD